MSTWAFSQDFGNQFKASRSDLDSRIESLKSTSPINEESFQEANVELAKLTKSLSEATGSLPSYDQRQYEQQLKVLQNALLELQAASKPRSKFAFKRKPQIAIPPTPRVEELKDKPPVLPTNHVTTNFNLTSRSYEYVNLDALPQSNLRHDLTISDLDHCIVNLIPQPHPTEAPHNQLDISALHVHNVTNTILILPVINGSVSLHNLTHCTLVVGCHQFRMHTSRKVDVYLSIPSTPIIEHCSDIRFAAYPQSLKSSLSSEESKHFLVQDFSHIRSTPSPHWSVLDNSDYIAEKSWPLNLIGAREELLSALEESLPR